MADDPTGPAIRELMVYDAGTGTLAWRSLDNPSRKPGPLGCLVRGRLQMRLGRKLYYVHRLVWLYHHDAWPFGQIDHINGDRTDNRIENLRDVTALVNMQNTSGRGVTFDKRAKRYYAQISVAGRRKHVGSFGTFDEARAAYLAAKAELHHSWVDGVGRLSA